LYLGAELVAHPDAMAVFRECLSARGLKNTAQREAIATVVFESDGHLSLNEVLERSRKRHSSVGFATVYRTMKLLSECGLVSQHRFGSGDESRYECTQDGEHHDHFICTECGCIVEFEDAKIEERQAELAAQFGFRVTSHRHEIYGVCAGCQAS